MFLAILLKYMIFIFIIFITVKNMLNKKYKIIIYHTFVDLVYFSTCHYVSITNHCIIKIFIMMSNSILSVSSEFFGI